MQVLKRFLQVLPLLLLVGCGSLTPGYEKPTVSITSFALAPESTGMAPRFNIGIRVINPNRAALPLRGMSYSVEIEGNRILNGAAPNLPTVPAFDTVDFVIEATPDLFGSVRLLSDLFARQRSSLDYTFNARIDTGGLLPWINVKESGNFGLPASRR